MSEVVPDELIVRLALTRDADEPGAPPLRVAFLNRVCSLGQLVYRRDAWPIQELAACVQTDGRWLVRVVSLSIDRDTMTGGRSQSMHESLDDHPIAGFPLRMSLTMAVQKALLDHFAHETGESLYYRGERILDPHAEDDVATQGSSARCDS